MHKSKSISKKVNFKNIIDMIMITIITQLEKYLAKTACSNYLIARTDG